MESEKDLKILRHSAAHLLAHAVTEIFPKTKITIGPATQEGFFFDFLPEKNFKEEDLEKIEARMHEISKKNLKLDHKEISKTEARKLYKDNPFKLEIIDEIPGETVGLSIQGDYYDLCKGGHVKSTGEIKYFKLLNISGSYWRADRNKQQLQRISGTAFFTQKDLDDFLQKKEDLLKYDHRKLGKELDLFSFHDEGPGFPFFHPKGKLVVNLLIDYMRKVQKSAQYKEISTPIILSDELWRRSGHYAHYKENMYFTNIDDKSYALKPMNCPGSILIYKERPRSYRELPLKLSEFGLVHRHELSGTLNGLLRVRSFTQDDAHIYCTPEQIEDQITEIINNSHKVFKKFGFATIHTYLSTKPENSIGGDELWEKGTIQLKNALENLKIPYTVQEGEGAFYGPKIDIKIEDSMNREWQLSTIQVDFFQPINFDLSYIDSSGKKEKPVIIHRAIYGSLERFFGILLEHHKGLLPFFVSPIQIKILTITDKQNKYAQEIQTSLNEHGIRVEFDNSSDPIQAKIKNAMLEKIPWMIIIGKKEEETNILTLRHYDGKQENLSISELIETCNKYNF